MRRLALLITGGAVWLFLAAVPAFADGGPHIAAINNGSSGVLNADGCAGCHRLHASKSPTGYLLTTNDAEVTDFCLSCHGQVGAGATTDVETGLQYYLPNGSSSEIDKTTATDHSGGILGALRSGGFLKARLGAGAAYRLNGYGLAYGSTTEYEGKATTPRIPVGDAEAVTSSHLALAEGFTATNKVWGNGARSLSAPAYYTFQGGMECTSCHNPHGNGNYRILVAVPTDDSTAATSFEASTGVNVSDDTSGVATYGAGYGAGATTRNYTVIENTSGIKTLTAKQVWDLAAAGGHTGNYGPASGDYFHKAVPYTNSGSSSYDQPNGKPSTFYVQMSAWCSQCHTRYASDHQRSNSSGDGTFMYQHTSIANSRNCLTCHVAHGSNANMDGNGTTFSKDLSNPDDTTAGTAMNPNGDSRLLKVDNRGLCLLCHDPTGGSALTPLNGSSLTSGDAATKIPQGTTPTLFP